MYYGAMDQPRPHEMPLLGSQDHHHSNSSPAAVENNGGSDIGAAARSGLMRTPSRRTGPVLASIMEKPHRRKRASTTGGGDVTNDHDHLGREAASEVLNHPLPKSFVYTMLNPRSQAWQAVSFKWFIVIVIVSDLVSFVVSTEPDLDESHQKVFHIWEGITSTIFLIEYLTRLVVVTEATKYQERGAIGGRISYALTTGALIDFGATFPFFLELISGWDLPTLTYLRSFRLLRILKTSGFAEAISAVKRVIYYNRQILYVALLICVGLVLLTSVLMYYLRPQDPDHSQDFKSLGATMYLSTLMLTGQGGPDGEMPWYTKAVVLLTGIFSIGMFAIPASMLTWGFEAEAERMANLAYAKQKKPLEENAAGHDNWSFSSDDYSTDEEYRRIIAGADDGEIEDEETESRKAFRLADIDGSGSISLTEYLAMSRDQTKEAAKVGMLPGVGNEGLTIRLNALEKCVLENSQKLDKICLMLEKMQ